MMALCLVRPPTGDLIISSMVTGRLGGNREMGVAHS